MRSQVWSASEQAEIRREIQSIAEVRRILAEMLEG